MKKYTLLLFLLIFTFALTACGSNKIEVRVKTDYKGLSDIQSVVDNSDVIVSGIFIVEKETMNLARDASDINKEDPTIYVEGVIYEFKVDEYILGKGDQEIQVVLEKSINNNPVETYYAPDIKKNCVLALNYNTQLDQYYPAGFPYEFRADKNDLKAYHGNPDFISNFKDKKTNIEGLKDKAKSKEDK